MRIIIIWPDGESRVVACGECLIDVLATRNELAEVRYLTSVPAA